MAQILGKKSIAVLVNDTCTYNLELIINDRPIMRIDRFYPPMLLIDRFYRPKLLIDQFYRPMLLIDRFYRPMLLIDRFYRPKIAHRSILSTDVAHQSIIHQDQFYRPPSKLTLVDQAVITLATPLLLRSKVQSSFICITPSMSRQNTTANQYTFTQTHIISPALWGCHVKRKTEDLMNGYMNCGMATTDKTALHPPSPWTTHVKDDPLATHSVQQGRGTQQNSILKSLCQWLHPLPEIALNCPK